MFSRLNPKLLIILHLKINFHRFYVLALFTNVSVVAAMLPIMAKLSVILRSEYVNTSALTGKSVKSDVDSAIKDYLLFFNYTPDFKDFSILATNNNDFKVTLIERLLINKDDLPLNKNKQTIPLELFDS